MKDILKHYRRRLLNLGSGNRALVLLRLYRELHLDVESLDFVNGKPAFEVLEKLLSGKKKISLSPYADSRHAPVANVSRRLRFIKRKAEMIFEERGSKELYMGWPFVHGKFSDGTAVRSPLLFFPVKLQVNAAQEWELQPDEAQPPQFNQSFLLAYAHYMGTPLAEELLELDLGTLPQQPLEFRTKVYELLKEHQLSINAGREFFTDKLTRFTDYKKADYEADLKPGQLHLEQEAVLGIFPQAASYLLSDYDELLEHGELQEMEQLFGTPDESINQSTQAQHTFTAFAMDAAQEAALQAVKQGQSLVVQGPPGTGKSQLICNLVSDFTARGKKVLVVSQKRAALDVVHQRLSQQGLGTFAALVHDINTDRKAIYTQLREQIERLDDYKKQNLALNSIYTDRTFLEVSRGINKSLETLQNFRAALFDMSRCGWSAKELYLRSSLQQPHIPLNAYFKSFTAATVAEYLPRLRQYLQKAIPWQKEDFVWKERRSMQDYTFRERQELAEVIENMPEQLQKMQQNVSDLSGYIFTLDELPRYTSALEKINRLQELLGQEGVAQALQPLLQQEGPDQLQKQVLRLKELYLVCPAPDAAIATEDLASVKAAVAKYEQQQKQLLGRISWMFAPEKSILAKALAKYKLELDEAGVGELQRRLELRRQAVEHMQEVNQLARVDLKIAQYPSEVLQKLKTVEEAIQAHKLLRELHREQVLHEKLLDIVQLPEHLSQLTQSINEAEARYAFWLQWLTEAQIAQLAQDEKYKQALLQELPDVFEHLVAFDKLLSDFTGPEREVAELLLGQSIKTAEEAEVLFLNSLYLAWLHALEEEHPELRMPSNGELERVEAELQRLLQEKQALSQEIVLSRLREQAYKDIELNRLGNPVTYRRLHAQVSKKRSLYPLRKLFSMFSGELLDLVPCWLASPETVSAVLPLERCFDLVIFDEASQCYAETGIPAMLRGKQVVVAGDAQQLKPSDIYRARWTGAEGEEETEELSAESLLQLCGLYLPQTMLTQHYRSRYPELIEFSNRYFYKNKLELIPELLDANARQPAINFVKVHGLWQANQNLAEAQRVVELVLQYLQVGQEELGVITFNYSQQMLVQDLLEEAAQQQSITIPASVLVKNIENIQGDEKEVIILSIGYAPDEKGRMAMQFGSLNQAGGENRLNVAVTRAKQQVVVVSSIRAEQLQVEHTLHAGPKLLKDYLHYAQQVSRRYFEYEPKQESMPAQVPLLKEVLAQQVPYLKQEVPFADLTFIKNAAYQGVVLTDDDLYYSALSVRHTHADIPTLLKQRHWPYKRVYSRQLWEKPEKTVEGVRKLKS
ncbi:AAA domain-containing protein [Pontibacter anaerobius]|uniref:AAA domain-containing protein n=1 Tax=Pontibacter anaerobius TaxID=2993940 RepID=A0ABT3R9V1_9BACT|nr:AAA domain-containing protein [Pontibacter anaerobius]MCX2738608.1 AAA domain-containing protein [Pontibacter anaerobius]